MRDINIKERTNAIRKLHTYGPTPLEEGILKLIEDLTGANAQPQQEPDLTKDMPKATPEAKVETTFDAGV